MSVRGGLAPEQKYKGSNWQDTHRKFSDSWMCFHPLCFARSFKLHSRGPLDVDVVPSAENLELSEVLSAEPRVGQN